MRYLKKTVLFCAFVSSASLNTIGLPLVFRAAGFVVFRAFTLAKNARPLAQQAKISLQKNQTFQAALRAAEPHLAKAESWALAHPKEAAGGITGGLIGWETSDEGIFNTAYGTVTGFVTGVVLCGYSGARATHQVALAELSTVKRSLHTVHLNTRSLSAELQAARTHSGILARKISELQGNYDKALVQLTASEKGREQALASLRAATESTLKSRAAGTGLAGSLKTLWELRGVKATVNAPKATGVSITSPLMVIA